MVVVCCDGRWCGNGNGNDGNGVDWCGGRCVDGWVMSEEVVVVVCVEM